MTIYPDLYLASQSPRRSELLSQIGISFQVLDIDVDETVIEDEPAQDYVIRLAMEKATAGSLTELSHSFRFWVQIPRLLLMDIFWVNPAIVMMPLEC
jgi:hypothetical protein